MEPAADRSFVLDLRLLVRQGIVRPGAFVRDGRVLFLDPASGRSFGATGLTVDTRRPDDPRISLRYVLVRTGEQVDLDVALRLESGRAGRSWRFVCPLGCARTAVRLHLPGGAARFGCRSCQRPLICRSEGPPAIRPIPAEARPLLP